jgi:hypothetical protein
MRVEPLIPDAPVAAPPAPAARAFGALLDAASGALAGADAAERAFIAQRGGLQAMVVERARADIALQIAAAGAQRVAQGLQTLLGMSI